MTTGQTAKDHAIMLGSLQRHIAAMHALWREALGSMTLSDFNHHERDGVLPIAFSAVHLVVMEDETLDRLGVGPSLWHEAGWMARVGVAIDDAGRTRSVAEMQHQRIGDHLALQSYADAVFARTEGWLTTLDASELDQPVLDRIPADLSQTYSARVAGDGPLSLYDAITCWIHQHGIRHLGEIEHARALVGLEGMTS